MNTIRAEGDQGRCSMNTEELKALAAPLVKWGADSAWENPSWTAAVGYIDEDGNRYPILTVDTTIYDGFEGDSLGLANFYAAANPAAILALIQQRDELLAALNSAASVSHSGGLCGYAEDDALRLVRVITLPYWDKSASDDKHREAIAKAEAQS